MRAFPSRKSRITPASPRFWAVGSRLSIPRSMPESSLAATSPETWRPWPSRASKPSILWWLTFIPSKPRSPVPMRASPTPSRTSTSAGPPCSAPRPRTTHTSPCSRARPSIPSSWLLSGSTAAPTSKDRRRLAALAFEHTAQYDKAIAAYMKRAAGIAGGEPAFPAKSRAAFLLARSAALRRKPPPASGLLHRARTHADRTSRPRGCSTARNFPTTTCSTSTARCAWFVLSRSRQPASSSTTTRVAPPSRLARPPRSSGLTRAIRSAPSAESSP